MKYTISIVCKITNLKRKVVVDAINDIWPLFIEKNKPTYLSANEFIQLLSVLCKKIDANAFVEGVGYSAGIVKNWNASIAEELLKESGFTKEYLKACCDKMDWNKIKDLIRGTD